MGFNVDYMDGPALGCRTARNDGTLDRGGAGLAVDAGSRHREYCMAGQLPAMLHLEARNAACHWNDLAAGIR